MMKLNKFLNAIINALKCATNICAGSVALPLLGVGKKRSRSDI